jgi:hypothetical protein
VIIYEEAGGHVVYNEEARIGDSSIFVKYSD